MKNFIILSVLILSCFEPSVSWRFVDNERNVGWIIFKPHVIFKSPTLWKNSESFMRLWIEAAPGISLACPF